MLKHHAPRMFFALSLLIAGGFAAAQSVASSPDKKADEDVSRRLMELEKKLAELQKQMAEVKGPRVVAAGTATWTRPVVLDNRATTRVKLGADVVAALGDNYIVLLTVRLNVGGYPYLVPYWRKAADGFDIFLVDTSLGNLETASYAGRDREYIVDWAVVKK